MKKYKAGYLICVRGSDGVLKGTSKVFININEAEEYLNKVSNLHKRLDFSIRLQ